MPAAAVPLLSVSVEPLPAVTDVGLNVAVAPAGTPETVSATLCADPLVTAVEIVEVPLAPGDGHRAWARGDREVVGRRRSSGT